jgi:predicted lipoprotein with Yx(FWY)xxD motif
MKNKILFAIRALSLVVALVLGMTACKDSGDDSTTSGGQTFTGIAEFETWLDEQPANTAERPYTVKVNVSDLGGDSYTDGSLGKMLRDNDTKYVNLDLSGSTLTTIEEGAFWYCTSLTSVTIPNSVTSIGELAFGRCSSLASVTIPASVTSIGQQAFGVCSSLTAINVDAANTAYSSQDGVLYNKAKTTLYTYPTGKTGAFTIPAGVTSIGEVAFYGCTSLASVTIPAGVTSIGERAFQSCTGLTSVTIGSGVKGIREGAFSSCTRLTEINVSSDNSAYTSQDGVLYNKNKTLLHTYPARKTGISFIIPNSVTFIWPWAFEGCTSLTSVTSIGKGAFQDCISLAAINVAANNSTYTSENDVLYFYLYKAVYRQQVNMTGYEKTVVKLAVPEDCRKLLYIPESLDRIFTCIRGEMWRSMKRRLRNYLLPKFVLNPTLFMNREPYF